MKFELPDDGFEPAWPVDGPPIRRPLTGRQPMLPGELSGKAVLDKAKVLIIRARVRAGASMAQTARDFGVGETTIFNIVHRRTWRHLAEEHGQ